MPKAGALWAGVAAQVVMLIALPLWGMLSDRIGRKPVIGIGLIGIAVLSFPLNAMLNDSAFMLFICMTIALIFISANVSIAPALFSEIFPTRIRAVGLAVPYSIAVALFGGTAPYLQTFFADKALTWVFTLYAVALGIISGLIALLTLPETKGIDLSHESVGAHARRKSATTSG